MIEPSFLLSREPSESRTSDPNVLTILRRQGVPGRTTWRAIMSASIMGTLWDLRIDETVDFPVAIPPVRPTTVQAQRYQSSLAEQTKH